MYKGVFSGLAALALAGQAVADVVEHYWDITWVNAAPNGVERPLVGINGQWPCPTLRAKTGDTVRVHMTNSLGNQTTGIHWHGINQISTIFSDGPSMATQCPVSPDLTITYEFEADAPGTYWYHSHNMGQYPDGFRGALIIDDPEDPFKDMYDEELIITASDWYNTDSITLGKAMLDPSNTRHLPPFPDSAVLNDGQGAEFHVEQCKTYRLRLISFSAFAAFMIHSKDHLMTVIANDGAYINPQEIDTLRMTPGQRYDVLIKIKASDAANFPILFALDQNRDFTKVGPTTAWNLNQTAYLIMDDALERPIDVVDTFLPADDATFVPYNQVAMLPEPTVRMHLDFTACFDDHGIPRQCFNGSPYIDQKVPTLYTAASTGDDNTAADVYGPIHPFFASRGDIVEIVLNNKDAAIHPFHLHGHHFQVLTRPASDTGDYVEGGALNSLPPRRDTVAVNGNSHTVLRFEADNIGVFLFHCHIEWHVEMGLTATLIESPEELRGLVPPQDHLEACEHLRIPVEGNAGGNTVDHFDQSNYNLDTKADYIGATYVPPPSRKLRRSSRMA